MEGDMDIFIEEFFVDFYGWLMMLMVDIVV